MLAYFQLCSEDYHWWWRSYFTSGSSALYLLLYSLFYFYTKLDITKLVPAACYFGYMTIISLGFFALTGTIGEMGWRLVGRGGAAAGGGGGGDVSCPW